MSRYPLRKFQRVLFWEHVTLVGNNDIKNLRRLIELVDPDTFTTHELCILNPTFGEASRMVGGANTDILLDDTLRDVKTVKDFDLKSPYFNQILGYYILQDPGGIYPEDLGSLDIRGAGLGGKVPVNKVAIYFSRHAYLNVTPVQEILIQTHIRPLSAGFKSVRRQ